MIIAFLSTNVNKMKRFILFIPFLFSLILIASSCTGADGYSFDHVEGKIKGEWTVDKVELRDNDKLFNSDVTGRYEGMRFNFKANNVLAIFDPKTNTEYPGVWYLDENYTWNEKEQKDEKSYSLYSYVYNEADTSEYREMTWKKLRVNNSRLYGVESRFCDDGKTHSFSYRLKK